MCGISGIYSSNILSEDDIRKGNNLVSSLTHRGPDNKQIYIDSKKKIFFGHNRLAIIYPHPLGNQPKLKGDYSIVFNGEIYNYKKLGYDFFEKKRDKSFSDTEILLDAWIKWKKKFVQYVDGMYAFAIYDGNKLYLATDYFGEKPIYYFKEGSNFFFSSEIKPLINILQNKSLNKEALDEFLALGFLTNGKTPYLKIKKLPANTLLTIDRELNTKSEKLIDNMKTDDKFDIRQSDIDDFSDIMVDSVKSRMEADTDISLLLSSGNDSSLIASIISKELKQNINTITLKNTKSDESRYAKLISEYLKIDNHTLEQGYEKKSIFDNCVNTLNNNLEIFAIEQLTNYLKLSGIKVCLSGLGADEIFYGYNKYAVADNYKNINLFNRFLLIIKSKIKKNFYKNNFDPHVYNSLESNKKLIYLKNEIDINLFKNLNFFHKFKFKEEKNFIKKLREFDINQQLQYSFLPSLDFASMQNSVELRSPYLNLKLLKFANRFNPDFLLKLPKKFFVKKMLSNYLPQNLINNKKIGFKYDYSEKNSFGDFKFFRQNFSNFYEQAKKELFKQNYQKILYRVIILDNFLKNNQ